LSHKQLLEQAQRNAEEIAAYLRVLDQQDRQDKDAVECRPQDVLRALDELRAKAARIDEQMQQLADSGVEKLVDTEPQARPMSSLYGAPGYNLQTAVEVESHLIVHHEVCVDANDQRQLLPMARATKQVLDKPTQHEDTATDAESPMIAVADGGFVNGEHFAKLEDEKIITFVAPKPGVNPGGLLDRSEFQFDAERDRYICPEGNVLKRKKRSEASRKVVYVAKAKDCGQCSRKPQCTNAAQRSVTKHLHEDAIEANARRVQAHPEMMRLRRQTVEHPFGTIKDHILRGARLLVRGLLPARGETSLAVIAYNLKRVFNMKGSDWMLGALAA
jgi:transposase